MKSVFIMCMVLLLASCDMLLEVDDEVMDEQLEEESCHMPLYFGDFADIDDIEDISTWIQYRVDYRECDPAYTPQQVIEQGFGDCDGFALLWLNIAFVRFNVKASLVMVNSDDERTIKKGGEVNHAVVQLSNGVQIDPQTGWVCDYPVRYIYSFNTVFGN